MAVISTRLVLRILWWIVVAGAVAFLALTLLWFVFPQTDSSETVGPADAIVVFVGSTDRLDTALELMDDAAAPNLVIPNGTDNDDAEDLCRDAPDGVFCPSTENLDTRGEAEAIGQIAREEAWSSVIAVTSVYHVRRATYLLGRCFDGSITAVSPSGEVDGDFVDNITHEWVGMVGAVVLPPSC